MSETNGNGAEKKYRDIGALWEQVSKKGESYLAGNVNGQKVVLFKVKDKRSDNQPDWRIYPSEDRQADVTSQSQTGYANTGA